MTCFLLSEAEKKEKVMVVVKIEDGLSVRLMSMKEAVHTEPRVDIIKEDTDLHIFSSYKPQLLKVVKMYNELMDKYNALCKENEKVNPITLAEAIKMKKFAVK